MKLLSAQVVKYKFLGISLKTRGLTKLLANGTNFSDVSRQTKFAS